jgi:hypothetical protein
MSLPDDWICPSSDRCPCGSICELREPMDDPEPIYFPGDLSSGDDGEEP